MLPTANVHHYRIAEIPSRRGVKGSIVGSMANTEHLAIARQ
jgi:hypothetical protein